jgi:hypothetical protein
VRDKSCRVFQQQSLADALGYDNPQYFRPVGLPDCRIAQLQNWRFGLVFSMVFLSMALSSESADSELFGRRDDGGFVVGKNIVGATECG